MNSKWNKTIVALCGLLLSTGCSYFGVSSFSMDSGGSGSGSSDRECLVDVWLDSNACEHGQVWCEISSSVSRTPKFKYAINDADQMGRVKSVIINVFREFNDGWSSNADFIVIATDTNDPKAQMKPTKVYDFGSPSETIKIMDGSGNTLEGMKLEAGMKYLMNVAVSADKSQTCGVVFFTP